MFIYTLIIALSLGFLPHLFLSSKPKTKSRVVELALLYQLVFNVGLLGILSFLGHTFLPSEAAAHLHWPTGPFQQELANASLGFGVIGVLCIWMRGHFWTAVVIGSSIWLFGDALDHIRDMIVNQNFSIVNTGIVFYSDFLLPILLVTLLTLHLCFRERRRGVIRPTREKVGEAD
jgi:hypothetical protein